MKLRSGASGTGWASGAAPPWEEQRQPGFGCRTHRDEQKLGNQRSEHGEDAASHAVCLRKVQISLLAQYWKLFQHLEKTCYNKEKEYLRNYQNFQTKDNLREVRYTVFLRAELLYTALLSASQLSESLQEIAIHLLYFTMLFNCIT